MHGLICPDSVPGLLGFFDFSIAPRLLFYTYIPTTLVSLFLGTFILVKDRYSLQSKLLFALCLSFTLWVLNVFVQWVAVFASAVMFSWQIMPIFETGIFIFAVYFVYVLLNKTDIAAWAKAVFLLIGAAIIVLLPTAHNISFFDLGNCEGGIGPLWDFLYVFQIVSLFWILNIGIQKYRHPDTPKELKRQIFYIVPSILLFVGSFAASNIIGEISEVQTISFVGSFGMLVFLAFLVYMIVRFKIFDIKLLAIRVFLIVLCLSVLSPVLVPGLPALNIIIAVVSFVAVSIVSLMIVRIDNTLIATNIKLAEQEQFESELLSIASHELKTPLTAIMGYNQGALEGDCGELSPELKKVAHVSLTAAASAAAMVDEFLDVARIRRGAMQYAKADCDVRKILEQVIFEEELNVQNKGLTLQKSISDDPDMVVVGDASRLRQVMYLLLDNAVHYTPAGGITVGLERRGAQILFSVKDTGVGIDPEDRPKLFTKFGRGKDSQKVNMSSNGLGLYLAKEFVTAHNGRIWVESEGKGKGSTFFVELPAKAPHISTEASAVGTPTSSISSPIS